MFEVFIDVQGGQAQWFGNGMERVLTLPTQASADLFRDYAVRFGDYNGNALGLYSQGVINGDNEANFMSFNTPEFLIQERGAACSWTPSKGITTNLTNVPIGKWKVQIEQCSDFTWNSILENILNPGHGVINFIETPEGLALFNEMLRNFYIGMANSYQLLISFGQSDIYDMATTEGAWIGKHTPEKWADLGKTLSPVAGHYSLIDSLSDEHAHLNVWDFTDAQLSTDGKTFIGDAKAFVDSLIAGATYEFSMLNEQNIYNGRYPVMKLSPSIFDRLVTQNSINSFAETNPTATNYFLTGVDRQFNLGPFSLMYKGYYIVKDHVQGYFDKITNTVTHRGMLVAGGSFGVANDVANLDLNSGMGARIYQDMRPKAQNEITIDTYGKTATAILNHKFISHAARTEVLPA